MFNELSCIQVHSITIICGAHIKSWKTWILIYLPYGEYHIHDKDTSLDFRNLIYFWVISKHWHRFLHWFGWTNVNLFRPSLENMQAKMFHSKFQRNRLCVRSSRCKNHIETLKESLERAPFHTFSSHHLHRPHFSISHSNRKLLHSFPIILLKLCWREISETALQI